MILYQLPPEEYYAMKMNPFPSLFLAILSVLCMQWDNVFYIFLVDSLLMIFIGGNND